jgi:hypothetical protein
MKYSRFFSIYTSNKVMQVSLITALIVKRYKRKNYSFVIILLNIRLISIRVVNPAESVDLFTFWPGGFAGSYFFDFRKTSQGKNFQKIQCSSLKTCILVQVLSAFEHHCTGCYDWPFIGLTLIPSVLTYCTSITEYYSIRKKFVNFNFERVS